MLFINNIFINETNRNNSPITKIIVVAVTLTHIYRDSNNLALTVYHWPSAVPTLNSSRDEE